MFGGMSIGVAKYGVPGAVLGVALAWFGGTRVPQAQAQVQGQVQPTGPGNEFPLTHQAPVAPFPRGLEPGGIGRNGTPRAISSGESSGNIALVVPAGNGSAQWLYIIDTKAHSFAIYKVDTAGAMPTVKLEVARQYQFDLKLDNYNNSGLKPADIEKVVKSLAQQAKH